MASDIAALRDDLAEHKIDFERRQGALSERVTRMESVAESLATREDLQKVKADIISELSDTIITKTDVDWLKRSFWIGVGILSSGIIAVLGLLLNHLAKP